MLKEEISTLEKRLKNAENDKEAKYDEAPTTSLVAVITSKSREGKRIINMILGKVTREEDIKNLKEHKAGRFYGL